MARYRNRMRVFLYICVNSHRKMYNVLSLFDGISCGQVALQRAGIPINKYYASEIDQRAVKVTQRNWPKTIQYGDVTRIRKEHFLSKIDILIGGSPCQGFSFAGKQLNFEDSRSKLFFEFVRLKNELQPTYFFLENVRMKKESQDVISKYLGVEPIFVNSALVSAQNRQRLYWTNIPGFVMPEDMGILLKDILENKPFDKTSFSLNTNPSGIGMNGKTHHTNKGSVCLTTNKGEGIKIINRCLQIGIENGNNRRHRNAIYSTLGKAPCVTAVCGGNQESKYSNGIAYRKATVIEYERLQGLPDGYTKGISNAAAYHALGNGWQVDTIVEFFKNIPH